MKRRHFLGAASGVLAFAGCLSSGSTTADGGPGGLHETTTSPGTSQRSTTDRTTTTVPPNTKTATTEPPDSTPSDSTDTPTESPHTDTPPNQFVVGEPTGEINPLGVTIRNEGGSARTVELTITDTKREKRLLQETVSVAVDGRVTGEIRAPSDYEVRAEVPEAGTDVVEEVDEGLFDSCNGYNTTVTVESGGELTAQTVTTLVLCKTATVTPSE